MDLAVLLVGFGLFGFIEPCSIGPTLIFIIKRGHPVATTAPAMRACCGTLDLGHGSKVYSLSL